MFKKKSKKQDVNHRKFSFKGRKKKLHKPTTKHSRKYKLVVFCIVLAILTFIYSGFCICAKSYIEINKRIHKVVIEYGTHLTNKSLKLEEEFDSFEVLTDLSEIKEVGEYSVRVKINKMIFSVPVVVKDTTPPKFSVKDIRRFNVEEAPKIEDFVVSVNELSKFKIKQTDLPTEIGEHTIDITISDIYGNETTETVNYIILDYSKDLEFKGLNDLTFYIGSKPDLKKGVSVLRQGQTIDFTVDDTAVNYKKLGTYEAKYSALTSLNENTTKTRKIIVKKAPVKVVASENDLHIIPNFPTARQFPRFPNGCESVALYILLKYYHVGVSADNIVDSLAKGPAPYYRGSVRYGGNPEIEFVGNPRGKGYGCYQRPIVNVANKYKAGIVDYSGHSLNEVLNLVARNIPVQIWASINMRNTRVCASWKHSSTGKTINWKCNLHSVVVMGYSNLYVYVSDPYTGRISKYSRSQVQKMYNYFGRRAIYYPN